MTKRKAPSTDSTLDGAFLRASLLDWYDQHERPLPWRVLWKKHRDPWHVWVSEIMLQQTVIKAVIPVYERFLNQFPGYEDLAGANTEDIRQAVRGLGYYRRFDLLHKASIKLARDKKGLPKSHDDWLGLPGIGAYTAAAISSITLGQPHGVVDGNVERVLCRILDIRTAPNLPHLKKQFKVIMDDLCSAGDPGALNQAVMELGQTICTPTSPDCGRCPVKKSCLAFARSSQAVAPGPKAKQEFIETRLRLEIIRDTSGIVLVRRPSNSKFLKETWGFSTFIEQDQKWHPDGTQAFNFKTRDKTRVGQIKHSITKHKINAEVFISQATGKLPKEHIRIVGDAGVDAALVSNLDRKAWNLLVKSDLT